MGFLTLFNGIWNQPKGCDHIFSVYETEPYLKSRCTMCACEHPDSGKLPGLEFITKSVNEARANGDARSYFEIAHDLRLDRGIS